MANSLLSHDSSHHPLPRHYKLDMELTLSTASDRFPLIKHILKDRNREVKVVREKETGRECIWKQRNCSLMEIEKVRRERQVQLELDHPSILKILYWVEELSAKIVTVVLIMEYVGRDLEKEIEVRKVQQLHWSESELLHLLGQLLSSLEYCQRHSIAHRDLKPSNLFLTSDQRLLLGDFGESRSISDLTRSLCGTLPYFCPIKRKSFTGDQCPQYDPFKSDVFSVGMTILQAASLLTVSELSTLQSQMNLNPSINHIFSLIDPIYSSQFTQFIRTFLLFDENYRPNFLTISKHFINTWRNKINLFSDSLNREMCGKCKKYEAAEFCLCEFPGENMCEKCKKSHLERGNYHEILALCFKNRFKTQEVVNRRKETCKVVKNTLKSLYEGQNLIKIEKERQLNAFNDVFEKLNKAKREIIDNLTEREMEVNGLIWDLREKLENVEVLSEDELYRLESVELPVVGVRYCHLDGDIPIQQPIITGSLPTLLHLSHPVILPLLTPHQLSLHSPYFPPLTLPINHTLEIDSETALIVVNCEMVVGYGGLSRPTQLFTFNYLSSNDKIASYAGLQPRFGAGLHVFQGILYIFAGKELLSAEKWDLCTHRNEEIQPLMHTKRHHFAPCSYQNSIFLPGYWIEIFDVKSENYAKFAKISSVSTFYYAYIDREILFICTNEAVLWSPVEGVNIKENRGFPGQGTQFPPVKVGRRLWYLQGMEVREWGLPRVGLRSY